MTRSEARTGCELGGLGVLVTRAPHQAEPLCRLIAGHGGRPLRFPALDIRPPRDPAASRARLQRLDDYDLLVFVSRNSVDGALQILGSAEAVPEAVRIGAVGRSTARGLENGGLEVDVEPEAGRYDSEGLLASPALQDVSGWRVLIVRGEGGRELLAAELQRRGAQVEYAEVYRRAVPEADAEPLLERWEADVDAVVATSGDILANLAILLGESGVDRLRRTPLVVVSERVAERARSMGCREVIRARGAEDLQVLDALCSHLAGGQRP